jgi:hypothetical protein
MGKKRLDRQDRQDRRDRQEKEGRKERHTFTSAYDIASPRASSVMGGLAEGGGPQLIKPDKRDKRGLYINRDHRQGARDCTVVKVLVLHLFDVLELPENVIPHLHQVGLCKRLYEVSK